MRSDDGPVPYSPNPTVPGLYLLPLDDSFLPSKRIPLPPHVRVRVSRQLNQKSAPSPANGVFESRGLSRQHEEAWVENGRVLIRDVKSLNGRSGMASPSVWKASSRTPATGLISSAILPLGRGSIAVEPKLATRWALSICTGVRASDVVSTTHARAVGYTLPAPHRALPLEVGVAHTVRMSRVPSEFYVVCAQIALAPVTGRTG
ncbi:hypothetical protein DFH08DRAFT_972917 [Mycena albidolilacea]|uniref:Uncharacterized protein n=1 Tax=Mycena albidolilacea TaxID=1033008 RepID=A0AAD7EDC1_9AGAR|nr:hypothetical protein DFH08DRAFT_972917 [Mycena albidolilacea]